MTDYYVWSGARGAGSGTSWVDAWTTLDSALDQVAAGNRILVHKTHAADLGTAAVTLASRGTLTAPVTILCVDKDNSNALSTGASESVGHNMTITGSLYCYGVRFRISSSATTYAITCNPAVSHKQAYDACTFYLESTNSGANIFCQGDARSTLEFRRCGFRFQHTSHRIYAGYAEVLMLEPTLIMDGGAAAPASLFEPAEGRRPVIVSGFDASAFGTGFTFVDASPGGQFNLVLDNIRMPSGWTEGIASCVYPATRHEAVNLASGSAIWHQYLACYAGTAKTVTDPLHTGGASDGSNDFAWQLVSNANCSRFHPLRSAPILRWNGAAGSAQTYTVEVLLDSATALTDADLHLQLEYLGTSGYVNSSFLTDAAGADSTHPFGKPDATGTAQASSSETWTGSVYSGMSNAQKRALSVTVTPQVAGWVRATVVCTAASKTLYVDPHLQVS